MVEFAGEGDLATKGRPSTASERMRGKKDLRASKEVAAAALLSLASSLPPISSSEDDLQGSMKATPVSENHGVPIDGLVLLWFAAFHIQIGELKQVAVRRARSKRRPSSQWGWIQRVRPKKKIEMVGIKGEESVQSSTSSSCVTVQVKESDPCPSTGRSQTLRRRIERRGYARYPGLRRRAKAILDFLSTASSGASEIHIRKAFGNSPDTSKALRILLHTEEIERSGIGGRRDPYRYMVSRALRRGTGNAGST